MMKKYQPFEEQNFYRLKNECLANGILFTDDKFPIGSQNYKWRRPNQLCSNPQFFVSGVSRFDVNQGNLGNCWLIAAMANLTLNKNVLDSVVCNDNGDFQKDYCGIFHFRLWHFGKFVDVVVDDLLPTLKGKKLVFSKSTDSNEFWSALLEKAYAKLYGGYQNIIGGLTSEAYEDFSGGVVEVYDLNYATKKMFDFIVKSIDRNVFFACGILNRKNIRRTGLIDGHAYSITSAKTLHLNSKHSVNLLRIRNPWGDKVEWNGAWSDRSTEWKCISEISKQEIGLTVSEDGEFWICFEDFKKNFDILEICNVNPDIEMRDPTSMRKWNLLTFEGTFSNNFSHEIMLTDPDEFDEEYLCTIVVALMQKNTRKNKKENETIGFIINSLEDVKLPFISSPKPRSILREICHRYELPPGRYSIRPFTSGHNDGEYLLRVFYETKCCNNLNFSYKKDSGFIDMNQHISAGAAKKICSRLSKQNRKTKSCACNLM